MITYRVIPKGNPSNEEAPQRYYANVLSNGVSDMRTIAEKISDRCTLTTVDTIAVLEALVNLIPQELADGKIVKLGDFGTFKISLRSEGATSAELFSKEAIKEAKVHFRQGLEFRKKFQNLNYS